MQVRNCHNRLQRYSNLLNKKKLNRILVVRISSLGDVLLTTPILRALKKKFPNSLIDFATSVNFKEVFEYNPCVNSIFNYDKKITLKQNKKAFNEFTSAMGFDKYDLVIDLQNNIRSKFLVFGKYYLKSKVDKNRLHKLFLVYFKKPLKKYNSIVEVYGNTLKEYGIKLTDERLEFWLPEEAGLQTYLPDIKKSRTNGELTISVAPGSLHFTKRWLTDYFIELIKMLIENYNAQIILLGSKTDIEVCSEIQSKFTRNVKNYAGTTNLFEAVRKLDKSDLLICNDSGLMHLANARRIPIVAIFGSTVKEFGFIPYLGNFQIVEKELSCRPCSHIGRDKCPKGHFRCMKEISADKVYEAVQKMIEKINLSEIIKN